MTDLERISAALAACRELPLNAPNSTQYAEIVGWKDMRVLEKDYVATVGGMCQLLMRWQRILGRDIEAK